MRVHVLLPLSVTALLGCARALPPPRAPCPAAPSPVVEVAPAVVVPPPELYDLTWKLKLSEKAAWAPVAATLHTFSLPRWECALGEVQSDDVRTDESAQVRRARRLACTHVTGITVQTKFDCQRDAGTAPISRELELALDAVPAVHIACEPVRVERLELSAGKQSLGALCTTPGGIQECAGSTP